MKSADNGYYKLTWRERIGFCSGELAQNLIYQTISIWLLFYYNNVYGLDSAVVAVMFLVVRIIDVVWDPMVGALVDKSYPRWGKYRSWILMGGFPLAAFANMITTPRRYFFSEEFLEECFVKLRGTIVSCHLKDIRLKPEYTFQLEECACGCGARFLWRTCGHIADGCVYSAGGVLYDGQFETVAGAARLRSCGVQRADDVLRNREERVHAARCVGA